MSHEQKDRRAALDGLVKILDAGALEELFTGPDEEAGHRTSMDGAAEPVVDPGSHGARDTASSPRPGSGWAAGLRH